VPCGHAAALHFLLGSSATNLPHEHDQAETTHSTSHIHRTETIINRKLDPSLRYLAAGDMFGSGGPSWGRIKKALAALPLADAAEKLMDGKAPWYREWASRRGLGDPWWKRANLTEALDQVQVPVLIQGG
jgi:predicted acyl esterase